MYRLEEKVIKAPGGFEYKYVMPDPSQTEKVSILIVSMIGAYPDGSGGNAHSRYISVKLVAGLKAFDPDCMIFDFRKMHYRWGNSLLRVFQDVSQIMDAGQEMNSPSFPVLVVTSETSRPGFLSLVTPSNGKTPEWHFENLNDAIRYGIAAGREWLEF